MTARDDFDAEATSGRAARRRNHRARLAGRLLAGVEWLDDTLVFWTGTPGDVWRLDGVPPPARAVLQDRLADRPAGLYAVRLGSPPEPAAASQPAKGRKTARRRPGDASALEAPAIEPITPARVAATARAIEASAKFPHAAARRVGPVDDWREDALRKLDARRRAVEGEAAWRAASAGALALEARAWWIDSAAPPSLTLGEESLASLTSGHAAHDDGPAARLAAVALGRRHRLRACPAALAGWAAAGRALDRWPPAVIARAAGDIGPDTLAASAMATPALNDAMAAAWAADRCIDASPLAAAELAGLAQILSAIGAVRREPGRRHGVMCRLAAHYLRLCRTKGPDGRSLASAAIDEMFRGLLFDELYSTVRVQAEVEESSLPDSPTGVASRWIGDELLDHRAFAYIDTLTASAADTLGGAPYFSLFEGSSPLTLTERVPPGSALDPAGAVAVLAAASRLRQQGAADAHEAMAEWLEVCRPLMPLASFWRDVLDVLPSRGAVPLDAAGAQSLVASLRAHGRRIAAEMVLGSGDEGAAARAIMPAVLVRGPGATERAMRWALWQADEQALDAALRFVEAAEKIPRSSRFGDDIPVPRDVFACQDPVLRDALLTFGLALWGERTLESATIVWLLNLIRRAAADPSAPPWGAVLPRLHDEARLFVRRLVDRQKAQGCIAFGSVADFTFIALDVCARWVDAGFGDTRRLARILSDRWPSSEEAAREWDADRHDHNTLIVNLSEGRIPRLLALLRLTDAPRRHDWRGIDGWRAIRKHPTALAWMSASLDRTELAGRAVRVLEDVALIMRLDPGVRPARLFAPLDRAVPPPPWPSWVQADQAAALTEVFRASLIAGVPDGLPGSLRRVLERRETVTRERAALRGRAWTRLLSPAGRARARRLNELLKDPETLDADLRRALRRELSRQRALVGLAALEALARQDLGRRWREVLGGDLVLPESPAWHNGLLMMQTVSHNRRVLRRLLQRAARGDREWMHGLGPNRAFLDRLAASGARPAEWLAARSRTVAVPGNEFTAYSGTDPLEVLQMGSLFGTCLSADRFNAHAAVAAAVEVNKRVLYVRDRESRVLGRQLLAIIGSGEVVGFTRYGSGGDEPGRQGSWVALALGLLALDIVRASGVRLATAARVSAGLSGADERSIELFCTGYVDSLECFDWWIEALAAADPVSGESDRERLRSILLDSVPGERDARAASSWRREELGWESCRALLWLGADAPFLSSEQEQALGIGPRQRSVLTGSR